MRPPLVVSCPREDCRVIVYIPVEGVPYDDAEVEHKLSRHWDLEHYSRGAAAAATKEETV